ncbi:MAG TPA: Ig-like domain-containing protein, partial [Saprospiraceae bacterium]|nr:Ig-like domain-containing protein [Saprospiraceae bacterium]
DFNVWDESVGQTCLEHASSAIADLTPALLVNADSYSTQSDESVSGNLLQNDSGLNIQLTGTSAVVGGIVSSSGDGSFTYTPSPGFSGTGSFAYTVTDACGNSSTGLVTITVIMISCNFTITSTLTTANCSLSDGAIAVQVNQPGSYQYHWNTGQTTSTITNIPAGTYTVTITDINTNCALSFNIVLNEYAPNYISNLHIFQPTCTSPAQIEFTLTAPGSQSLLTVSIEHPGGLDAFPVEEGVVELSDYVDLVEGQYHVEVFIGDAAPNCVDDFSATLTAAPSIAIEAGDVTPPTNQSSMDGSVIINVTDPGQHPYTIYVDGVIHGTSSSETINVTGLGVGFYDIYIEDAAGCVSNTVSVIIPIPPIVFSFEAGLLNLPTMATNEHPGKVAAPVIWKEGFISTIYYHIGGLRQSMAFSFAPPARIDHLYQPGWSELNHLSTIYSLQYPQFHFSADGGMGLRFVENDRFENPLFLTLRVSSDY